MNFNEFLRSKHLTNALEKFVYENFCTHFLTRNLEELPSDIFQENSVSGGEALLNYVRQRLNADKLTDTERYLYLSYEESVSWTDLVECMYLEIDFPFDADVMELYLDLYYKSLQS